MYNNMQFSNNDLQIFEIWEYEKTVDFEKNDLRDLVFGSSN